MVFFSIRTERLDLIPATLDILEADRRSLARLLDASVPPSWPPPLLDGRTLDEFARMVSEGGDPLFSVWYWVLVGTAGGGRVLVGSGGIASSPADLGTVLIGYSVLDEFQGRGYATEAIRHIVAFAFSLAGVRQIDATTYPEFAGSIRVLEKNGFVRAGKGFEAGTIRYVLKKPGGPA